MKTTRKSPREIAAQSQRLDTWLWVARFFRTRKLAAQAVSGGHVYLNEQKSKPGKGVKIGDQLRIRRNLEDYHIVIQALSPNRVSPSLARVLYLEPEWSSAQREEESQRRRQGRLGVRYDRHRPNKRDRRTAREIKHQSSE